ncbi:hypothetical protein AU378_13760 [Chryseobacterium kwangjuense]|uniref:Uncharacterized protein n=1 Tax=Chryseobacterium kwangjuense TaxID=267125 RepID=A0A135WEX7_9FLAO|nr:hypothetical protein AU378_13760 [Chryseobacterium kwangjuense]
MKENVPDPPTVQPVQIVQDVDTAAQVEHVGFAAVVLQEKLFIQALPEIITVKKKNLQKPETQLDQPQPLRKLFIPLSLLYIMQKKEL